MTPPYQIVPLLHHRLSELELTQSPLPANKAEQLVQIMSEERAAMPMPAPPTSGINEAYANKIADWQASLDQRVRDRAVLIIPLDTLTRLESFQNSQRAGAALFAPTSADESASAPKTNNSSNAGPAGSN